MEISDVEIVTVQIPRGDGAGAVRSVLVCLTSDAGLEGWGEAPLGWRASELADRQRVLLAALASRNVFDTEELVTLAALKDAPLRCAVETAVWDLVGRACRQPLCRLFGGLYRLHVPLAVRVSDGSAHAARELAEHGFHTQVISASGDVQRDEQCIKAIADAAHERGEIRFDGCNQFSVEEAARLCARLTDDQLPLMVDMLHSDHATSLAGLAEQVSAPLGLHRSIRGPRDVLDAIRAGATHVVVDLFRVGGLLAARKCISVAEAGGLPVSLAAEASVGVATAAMLQIAAAAPAVTSGNLCDYGQLHDDALAEPLEFADGMLVAPQAAGLGVSVDREKIDKYRAT